VGNGSRWGVSGKKRRTGWENQEFQHVQERAQIERGSYQGAQGESLAVVKGSGCVRAWRKKNVKEKTFVSTLRLWERGVE